VSRIGRWFAVDRWAVAGLNAAAGLTFAPAFEPGVLTVPVLAAAVLPAVVPDGRRVWRVARVLLIISVGVYWGQWIDGWAALGRNLVHGILLTWQLTLPLPPGLSVIPAAMTGAASMAGTAILLRRPGQVAAAVPAAVVAACGTGAAGHTGFSWLSLLIGLAGLGLLLAVQRPARVRVAAAVVAVVAAMGVALWSPPTPGPRAEPRALAAAPVRLQTGVDLLDRVGGWQSEPDAVLFYYSATPAVARWRLAVLDDISTGTWAGHGSLQPAGLGVPGSPADGVTVRQHITLAGLDGPFRPSADRPVRVTGSITAVDPESAVLVGTGRSYDIVSRRPASTPVPEDAGPAAGPAVDLVVPEALQADLQRLLADANIPASTSAAERARRLAGYLGQHRRNVRGAAVAGDVAAVRRFLDGGPGTSAQFAATFALAMRATGVPARLVVGFQPARAGATAVTGGDARVWVELSYAGLGWQTYDVTPPAVTDRYTPAPDAVQPTTPVVVAAPPPASFERHRPTAPAHRSTLGLSLAAGLIALAVALYPRARRAGRRIRRRWSARTSAARVVAAWQDAVDRLALDAPARARLTPTTARALFPGEKPIRREEVGPREESWPREEAIGRGLAAPRGKADGRGASNGRKEVGLRGEVNPHAESRPPGEGARGGGGAQHAQSGDARDILTCLAERALFGAEPSTAEDVRRARAAARALRS
jgi:hypothetical protein